MNSWIDIAPIKECQSDLGFCYKHGDLQVAIFNFNLKDWYAIENLCPHEQQMVLSRGIVGDSCNEPKVACPLHKHAFDLKDGSHLGGKDEWKRKTYPVKVENGIVKAELPNL